MPLPHSEDGVFAPGRRALTVGLLLCVVAFAADGMGVVPALPVAARELDGLPLFGWVFGAFMLAWLIGTVAGGQLADARGPLLPMALGLGSFAAGLILAALARNMAEFLAGRAVQGVGGGAMIAVAYVAVARGYPDSMRARMLALTSTAWILPAAVGPVISGTLTELSSWRAVFAAAVPLVGVAAIVVLPALRPFSTPASTPLSRVPHALQLAIGAGLVLAAPSARGAVSVALAAGGLVLAIPPLRALMPPGTLSGRRGLPMGLASRAIMAFAFFGAEAFVPLSAAALRGASPTRGGTLLTAAAFGWVAASWAQDRLEARLGARGRARRVTAGFVGIGIGTAVTAAGLLDVLPFAAAPFGWMLAGAGMGTAYGALGLLCLEAAPAGMEGALSSQLQIAEALGTASGACIGGLVRTVLADGGTSPRFFFAVVFAVSVGAALFGAATGGRLEPHRG